MMHAKTSADVIEQQYRDRPVCVTGGAGFIGSHLVEALVARGAKVTAIDDLSSGRRSNLDAVRDRVRFVEASILDAAAVDAAVAGAAVVFHLAAVTSVPRSVEQPDLAHQVNANGTFSVLDAARKAGAQRVVYASSSSVYGEREEEVKVETMCPQPQSPYAASKYAGEVMLQAYTRCYAMAGVTLRYFNIFGPRQRADSPYAAVVPKFIDAMRAGRPVTIYGDGTQTRDFTPVANAVHANLLAGAVEGEFHGQPINVACGTRHTVMAIAQEIAALLGVEGRFKLAPKRPGDILHSRAGIDRAREVLEYEPVEDLRTGLERAVRAAVAPSTT